MSTLNNRTNIDTVETAVKSAINTMYSNSVCVCVSECVCILYKAPSLIPTIHTHTHTYSAFSQQEVVIDAKVRDRLSKGTCGGVCIIHQ